MTRLFVAAATIAGLLTALPAAAQFQKPEDAVKYRKAGMTMIAAHFGRIGAMAQGKAPYNADAAIGNADAVAYFANFPFAGFVEGTSGTEKGTPKANVWTERAKFDAAAKSMQEATAKLAVAAKAKNLDTLKAAFGDAAKTCKGCHDDFRNQ